MARLRIALIGASTETRILEIHCRPSSGGVVGHMVVYVDGWLAVCLCRRSVGKAGKLVMESISEYELALPTFHSDDPRCAYSHCPLALNELAP